LNDKINAYCVWGNKGNDDALERGVLKDFMPVVSVSLLTSDKDAFFLVYLPKEFVFISDALRVMNVTVQAILKELEALVSRDKSFTTDFHSDRLN